MGTWARAVAVMVVGMLAVAGGVQVGQADSPTIAAVTATVGGVATQILTDGSGRTLYYFTGDTPTRSGCTGACASTWPALLSDARPTAGAMVPGRLSTVKTPNGPQVAYNGHLLYTYSGDHAPGDTYGHGVAGKWFVATADLKAPATPTYSGPAPDTSGGGGYGH